MGESKFVEVFELEEWTNYFTGVLRYVRERIDCDRYHRYSSCNESNNQI